MNQAEVHKLVSKLRFHVQPRPFKGIMGTFEGTARGGPRYQLEVYREAVTALVVNERIEMSRPKGMMVREYSERLLQEAITHGETHMPTMEMADFWLLDKPAIHKLFKVLVPRLKEHPHAYTRYFHAPMERFVEGARQQRGQSHKCVLEIVGHPFPPLAYSNTQANRKMIHNVLLSEAKREHRMARNKEEETRGREEAEEELERVKEEERRKEEERGREVD